MQASTTASAASGCMSDEAKNNQSKSFGCDYAPTGMNSLKNNEKWPVTLQCKRMNPNEFNLFTDEQIASVNQSGSVDFKNFVPNAKITYSALPQHVVAAADDRLIFIKPPSSIDEKSNTYIRITCLGEDRKSMLHAINKAVSVEYQNNPSTEFRMQYVDKTISSLTRGYLADIITKSRGKSVETKEVKEAKETKDSKETKDQQYLNKFGVAEGTPLAKILLDSINMAIFSEKKSIVNINNSDSDEVKRFFQDQNLHVAVITLFPLLEYQSDDISVNMMREFLSAIRQYWDIVYLIVLDGAAPNESLKNECKNIVFRAIVRKQTFGPSSGQVEGIISKGLSTSKLVIDRLQKSVRSGDIADQYKKFLFEYDIPDEPSNREQFFKLKLQSVIEQNYFIFEFPKASSDPHSPRSLTEDEISQYLINIIQMEPEIRNPELFTKDIFSSGRLSLFIAGRNQRGEPIYFKDQYRRDIRKSFIEAGIYDNISGQMDILKNMIGVPLYIRYPEPRLDNNEHLLRQMSGILNINIIHVDRTSADAKEYKITEYTNPESKTAIILLALKSPSTQQRSYELVGRLNSPTGDNEDCTITTQFDYSPNLSKDLAGLLF